MKDRVLTLRELNRATLARQLLLERSTMSVPAAIEHQVGLQAQQPISPYLALWSRLQDFKRDNLARHIEDRTIIKAALMRGTLHLFTAADYLRLRGTLQLALDGGFEDIAQRRAPGVDLKEVIEPAKRYLAEKPRTFAEISKHFAELLPETDIGAIRHTIRMKIPLVQVPVQSGWSYPGNPQFTLAESWLSQPIPTEQNLRTLVLRYLAAFGPATVADIQTWSGIGVKEVVEQLRPELITYRDERKRELFDLPNMHLPDPDSPVPERFLPEYDNLLLSHKDRTRIIANEYRKKVYLPGLRVASTILVDGFVRGAWKIEKTKGAATLTIQPFATLTRQNRTVLTEEGERLVRFVDSDAKSFEVRFAD